ncbi:ribosome maturation factor RimP [Hyphomicrobium sp. CS1BSMeth3]|uniref:ribosome maturation factor RimP n=1 Tax=Hyphomicrobium sp. CS1BSMeth3 TaxID=1892844 RepID=UPI000931F6C2|nr:ribosome maturation factor RimP [Hyphomicrobium sp. CS1BSMeth3]
MERLSGPAEEARFVVENGVAARVASLIEPVLESMGYRLVQVRQMGGTDAILEIMAERLDGTMTVEDCEAVSHAISPLLDVHDPVEGSYRLQISSPGIDRPLVRPADFERWAGYEAKIELKEPVSGRKRFRGPIEGFADGEARIEIEVPDAGRQIVGLPLALIGSAKLVLTDELVRDTLRRAKGNDTTAEKTDKPARKDARSKDARKDSRRTDVTKVK